MNRVVRTIAILTATLIASHARSGEPPKDFTNSVGMRFRLISAGEFLMRNSNSLDAMAKESPSNRPASFDEEYPQHKVTITGPIFMGTTEVTQGHYEKVMGENPSWFAANRKPSRFSPKDNPVYGKSTSDFPVENVSWNDATRFCERLSAKEEKTYRLPTGEEWEYACRAGTTTTYSFGDDGTQLGEYAWFGDNSGEQLIDVSDASLQHPLDFVSALSSNCCRTHPVATKKPNAWGLYDMHGNVLEWCSDTGVKRDATKNDPIGPTTDLARVCRGGCWAWDELCCRSAYRHQERPGFRSSLLGFRVVLVPSDTKSQ